MRIGPAQAEGHLLPLAAMVGVVFLAYLGLVLSAAADGPWACAALLVAVLAMEWAIEGMAPALSPLLRVGLFGIEVRGVLQALSFALLVSVHFLGWSTAELAWVLAVVVCMMLGRAGYLLVLFGLRGRLVRPIQTLNVDLGPLARTSSLPVLLTEQVDRRLVHVASAVLLAGTFGVAADQIWPFLVLGMAYVLAVLAAAVVVVVRVVGPRGLPSNAVWEPEVLERVRALEPEVVLYFSGSPEAAYQLNMWLGPLADLGRPALVMLRERHVLDSVAPTDLPVVCLPGAVSVMQAKLSTARVAFYAAHTSKNIHLLREPGMRHVFIGHGDSDKVSSINPFAKAYDEVWVAGRAGRDRWAAARVGVRDESVVEVGRPQLEAVLRADAGRRGDPLTVLYAPTWEGWTDEDFGSSITHMGPTLVRGLLAADPPVRVLYKPHPFTGVRDKRALRSHEAIVAMLGDAVGPHPALGPDPELAELERLLERRGLGPAEHDRLSAGWSDRFWTHQDAGRHVVVGGARPVLFDCFNHADVLVSDVSSVVSDFLASGKPYVCANPRGVDEAAFRAENPSTTAAYLLGPDCAELPEILALVRGADPRSTERAALREYLLGPDEPPSIDRWRAAVDALAATVDRRAESQAAGMAAGHLDT